MEMRLPEKVPLLVIPNAVLFPGASMRIRIMGKKNLALIQQYLSNSGSNEEIILGIIPLKADEIADNNVQQGTVGTAALVLQTSETLWNGNTSFTIFVTGTSRIKVRKVLQRAPYPIANVELLETETSQHSEVQTEFIELSREFADQLALINGSSRLQKRFEKLTDDRLLDLLASILKMPFDEKRTILAENRMEERYRIIIPHLKEQLKRIKHSADNDSLSNIFSHRKFSRALPRAQHNEQDNDDLNEWEDKLKSLKLPPKALSASLKELNRLRKMPPQSPEYSILRNYLSLIMELPWNDSSDEVIDIEKAQNDLDADHFGMEKIKKRVLEYLAVRMLKNTLSGPILCLVGPPGVGKTSIGRSIANTLGRQFHRISLGGISDQSDIRGHRRTYIGSMPGRIIQGLKTAGVNNPVFLLDEIDKMSKGLHGDPSAALLEVLDPEQNRNFVDHYLNLEFDLSQVLFIATANTLSTVPRPLKDRMEIVEVPGYTQEDKVSIAQRHLIPKQLKLHGLKGDPKVVFQDSAIKFMVSRYTREAGVRSLERHIAAICRDVALKLAKERRQMNKDDEKAADNINTVVRAIVINEMRVEEVLGHPVYESTLKDRVDQTGVAVGLAWTSVGGQIMLVETSKMPGSGKIQLTGQLGDVMRESAQIALNWVRAHAAELTVADGDLNFLENVDIHIHFPEGAVGKDGPSAGITIVAALVSLLTNEVVRPALAMTGEMTLRGVVLPVGGIKEKILAAHREGINTVILPKANRKDLRNIEDQVKESMSFKFVSCIEEVLDLSFERAFPFVTNDVLSKL